MANEKVLLAPHPVWEIMEGINTFEDYAKLLPVTRLNDGVDESIKAYYEPIRKLLEFGYFEYSFITMAFRSSFQMLELILRVYYKKHIGKPAKHQTLNQLIIWFANQNLIDKKQAEQLQLLRELRNGYAHPSENTVAPLTFIKIIDDMLILANEFYGK
ncbi:DUF4145 domain-containing protein [Mucilaginibacter angelicae]|uniref:DUF4145 domain-containing protein n=1 Tax=Mucilaginibacter angelicae TaxID=869718 RepID=A0ABV6L1B0_9SPHI